MVDENKLWIKFNINCNLSNYIARGYNNVTVDLVMAFRAELIRTNAVKFKVKCKLSHYHHVLVLYSKEVSLIKVAYSSKIYYDIYFPELLFSGASTLNKFTTDTLLQLYY